MQEQGLKLMLLLNFILILFLLTYNPEYSIAYLSIVGFNIAAWLAYTHFKIRIGLGAREIRRNLVQYIVITIVAYVTYLIAATAVGGLITPGAFTFASVIKVMAQNKLILAGNMFITFIAFGVLTPIIESDTFFGRLTDILASYFKIDLKFDLLDIKKWVLGIAIASLFWLFHLQAKVFVPEALVYVFIFGLISYWIVLYTGRTAEACIFHMFANMIVLLVTYGIISI